MRKCFVTQYCVLSSQITSVGYVGNVICLKFAQESFKVLFEKELVKNMMYLMWELNPRLSVHETDTLPSELPSGFTSAKLGLNRRPSELQSDALPTELLAGPIEYECKNII